MTSSVPHQSSNGDRGEQPRVLMLLENSVFGDDVRVSSEATALRDAGYQVMVISPCGSQTPYHEFLDGIEAFRYPAPPESRSPLGYLWEYSYTLLLTLCISIWVYFRRGFRIIHSHNPPDLFVLIALLFRPLGVKFVFDQHDLSPEMYSARFAGGGNRVVRRILEFFERLSCRTADHVIATNDSYRRLQLERTGIPEDKSTVVRNGPKLDRFVPAPLTQKPPGAPISLGYAGVLGRQDGIDYMLRALWHLKHDFKRDDFECVVMGDGVMLEELRAMAIDLGIDGHMRFTGYLRGETFIRELGAIEIGLVPDPYNNYNDRSTMIKIMEYMAMEKPIVAFDLTEHRVSAEGAAIYADKDSEYDFAGRIVALMDDPERRGEMGRLGRRRIESDLAWRYQAPHLVAAYKTLGVLGDDS